MYKLVKTEFFIVLRYNPTDKETKGTFNGPNYLNEQ